MHMPLVSNQDGHLRSEQSRLILKMILATWLPSNLAMGIAHDDIEVKCLVAWKRAILHNHVVEDLVGFIFRTWTPVVQATQCCVLVKKSKDSRRRENPRKLTYGSSESLVTKWGIATSTLHAIDLHCCAIL
ncbi:hypothetical protein SeMB42_g03389 [Synchytrium endobioticum]|uniref:Uncharacterized protein n=1 Tax=Synchytrium endobioticum TaxID=286115 RepID=A0A507D7I5_9FUNG|nr:hypothetical protein SeMB42_g03389 [Synchytrium endobioticum]